MPSLFERIANSAVQRLVLLAPAPSRIGPFRQVQPDSRRRRRLLHALQRLRGRVYLADSAVRPAQLTRDGRHAVRYDDCSWHLLTLNPKGKVTGCGWYLPYGQAVAASDLRVGECPLAYRPDWRNLLWTAVGEDIQRARRLGLGYAEFGGWAISRTEASLTDSLLLVLAGFGLSRLHGGALGLTTATVRHCSSTILRRLGGRSLEVGGVTIPSYFDPRYGCDMEVLRFDSRAPNPRYEAIIERLADCLKNVIVVAPSAPDLFDAVRFPLWGAANPDWMSRDLGIASAAMSPAIGPIPARS